MSYRFSGRRYTTLGHVGHVSRLRGPGIHDQQPTFAVVRLWFKLAVFCRAPKEHCLPFLFGLRIDKARVTTFPRISFGY